MSPLRKYIIYGENQRPKGRQFPWSDTIQIASILGGLVFILWVFKDLTN